MEPTRTNRQQLLVEYAESLERATPVPGRPVEQDRRESPRNRAVFHGEVCLFNGSGETRTIVEAATCNLTFHGLSVVVQLHQPIQRGRPAEVLIALRPAALTHLAGIVTFCRRIQDRLYEIGVHVKASGPGAILMHDVETTRATYDWFDQALQCDETPDSDALLDADARVSSAT